LSLSAAYHICFFAVLAALIYGAVLLRFPSSWIVIGGLSANLIGILVAGSYAKQDAPPRV
jgi:hypothetical protein